MWKCVYRKRSIERGGMTRKTITDMLPRLDGRGQRRYDGRNAVSVTVSPPMRRRFSRPENSVGAVAPPAAAPGQVRSTQRPSLNATSSLSPSRKPGLHPKRLIWRLNFRSRPTLGESYARPFCGRSAVRACHSPPGGGLEIDRPWGIVPGNADLDFTGPCPLVALYWETAP